MKVFIMTKCVPFGQEVFVDVASSKKVAEKKFRELFPHMRVSGDVYVSDKDNTFILFIKEKTVLD